MVVSLKGLDRYSAELVGNPSSRFHNNVNNALETIKVVEVILAHPEVIPASGDK